MNQRRNETNKTSSVHIVMVFVLGLLLTSAGVLHAVIKNDQVTVARDIDATEIRIEAARENMKMVQVKIDRKLNRHMIRAELAARGSDLEAIPSSAVEVVTSNNTGSVAQTTP